uniref:Uncharacterized protein n=1 Tax=Lepeophtheirus salmonis TaxID=72036 RepID=A0A0K2UCK2_LEPSM
MHLGLNRISNRILHCLRVLSLNTKCMFCIQKFIFQFVNGREIKMSNDEAESRD